MTAWLRSGFARHHRLHKLIGEGNFILAITEGESAGGKPTAFHDLCRVEDGRIAEQWTVTEIIAPREAWKNGNGKF